SRSSGLGDAVAGPRGDDDRTARCLGGVEHGALTDLAGLVEAPDFGQVERAIVLLRLGGRDVDAPETGLVDAMAFKMHQIAETAFETVIVIADQRPQVVEVVTARTRAGFVRGCLHECFSRGSRKDRRSAPTGGRFPGRV